MLVERTTPLHASKLTRTQEIELEVAEFKMFRFLLRVTRMNGILKKNVHIRGMVGLGWFGDIVNETRLKRFGHIKKRGFECVDARMLEMQVKMEINDLLP